MERKPTVSYADRLVTPAEAITAFVPPGGHVWAGNWTSVPLTLCEAIAAHAPRLSGTTITTSLSPFNWDRPEVLEHLKVRCAYAGPHDRKAVNEGRFEYVPVVRWRAGQMPPGIDGPFDAALIPISPPDEDGWCSFAGGVWFSQSVRGVSRVLIGEVCRNVIRTGGENRIHISEFSALVMQEGSDRRPEVPPRSPETEAAANVICALVASEILRDGATIQMGVGDVSAAMPVFLDGLRDLGIHSEIIPGGVVDLVERGVVTGRHKGPHRGKVVGTAFVLLPDDERRRLDGHEAFELYDFTYVDDLHNLLQLKNFFAINNALAVDLTGNVTAETMGTRIFSGPGGQTVFAVAAATTNNGSVIVVPSSQVLPNGERVSRIVPILEPGSTATVHRAYVDYVVTEYGIARLTGKSLRERINEMLAIAHPDLRAELKARAEATYAWL